MARLPVKPPAVPADPESMHPLFSGEDLNTIAAAVALPPSLICVVNFSDPVGQRGEQWEGLEVALAGLVGQAEQDPPGLPFFVGEHDTGQLTLFVLRARARWRGCKPFAEGTWMPGQAGRFTVHDVGQGTIEEDERALRSVRFLQLAIERRGRKQGSSQYTREEFTVAASAARRRYIEKRGRPPTDLELAAELGISSSTFYRYQRAYGDR